MDTLQNKQVKTRKPQKCWGCWEEYPAGTEMQYIVQVDGGDFMSAYWCKTCRERMDKLPDYWLDDGVSAGSIPEMWEEYNG